MEIQDLIQIRKDLNLSRRDLAKEIEVNYVTVWGWESGKTPFNPHKRVMDSIDVLLKKIEAQQKDPINIVKTEGL